MKHAQNNVPSYSFGAHRQESVFRFWTPWSSYLVWQLVLNISKKHTTSAVRSEHQHWNVPAKHWYLLPRLNGVQPRRPHLNTYHHKNLQTS